MKIDMLMSKDENKKKKIRNFYDKTNIDLNVDL